MQVGNFLGVVAPKEYDAIQAAAQLKVKWSDPPTIARQSATSGRHARRDATRAGKDRGARIDDAEHRATSSVDAAMTSAAKTYSGTFKYHYQMHAPIGPNVAVADVTAEQRDRSSRTSRTATATRARRSPQR